MACVLHSLGLRASHSFKQAVCTVLTCLSKPSKCLPLLLVLLLPWYSSVLLTGLCTALTT